MSNKENFRIDLREVSGVLIDIDDTMYSYEAAHSKALSLCGDTFIKTFSKYYSKDDFLRKYREKRNEVWERLTSQGACRSRLFAFLDLFEELNIPQAFNEALYYESLYWQSFLDNMTLARGVYSFLQKCKSQNILVCVISDMQAHFQIQKLQKLNLSLLIDYLVTSEEVGVEKPSSIIFQRALSKMNLHPHDVIMIGDSQEKDIQGAIDLGIRTFRVYLKNDSAAIS